MKTIKGNQKVGNKCYKIALAVMFFNWVFCNDIIFIPLKCGWKVGWDDFMTVPLPSCKTVNTD